MAKQTISIGFICDFKEHPAGNTVIGAPKWVAQFVNNNADNPIREFLDEINPGGKLNIVVTVESISP
jgi:hypothetical protein